MEIKTSSYIGSFPSVGSCPKEERPEYAFIGRSNVGKSSLINMITGRNNMARISKKPGKTQMINYFLIDGTWNLVDLPGYGYAKISKSKRQEWRIMVEGYLIKRELLQCAFVLIDANISPQQIDLEFINWLGQVTIPFAILFTKADRSKPAEIEKNVENFREKLLETWNALPPQFITSANSGIGKLEILGLIAEVNDKFYHG